METKSLQIKSIGDGTASVVFATLNVIDKDGDLTINGAFGNQTAAISPAHKWEHPSLGIAKVREQGNEAIADLQFNMDMPAARDWHAAIKFAFENGAPQEFSYGFNILASRPDTINGRSVRVLERLKVLEVSPVMQGAGVNTRTLAVKTCQSCAGKSALSVRDELAAALATNDALIKRLQGLDAFTRKGRVFDIGESYRRDIKRLKEQAAEIAARVAPNDPGATMDPALVASIRSNLARYAGRYAATN